MSIEIDALVFIKDIDAFRESELCLVACDVWEYYYIYLNWEYCIMIALVQQAPFRRGMYLFGATSVEAWAKRTVQTFMPPRLGYT